MTVPTAGALVLGSAKAILASAVRTLVPILVGVVIAAFAKVHIDLDTGTAESLVTGAISAGISLVYYVGVRALEVLKSSKFGWLLGYAKAAPVYVAPAAAATAVQDVPQTLVAQPEGKHEAPTDGTQGKLQGG